MPESQSLAIEWWPLDRIRPYEQNPRVISDAAIDKVAASIKTFGWRQPIVVDDAGVILVGHTRLQAAKRLNLEQVPVHVAAGLSVEAARAYRLADNRTHDEARWNTEGLGFELAQLAAAGFDLALTGFDPGELPVEFPGEQPILSPANATAGPSPRLAERFGIPPFSVFNAREGWWQDRKRAWIDLGIRSELGRGAPIGGAPLPMDRLPKMGGTPEPVGGDMLARARANFAKKANAAPGGSAMPAADYSKTKARGDGRGRAVKR